MQAEQSIKHNIKLCQSCIERGYNSPNQATREYTPGVYYCDDCFMAVINNMLSSGIHHETIKKLASEEGLKPGPFLATVYEMLKIPTELQFVRLDNFCRHRDEIFNHFEPAVINKTLEEISAQIEENKIILFQFTWREELLEQYQNKLKEERRVAKGLKSFDDSKEIYSNKGLKKVAIVKQKQEDKIKKGLGKQDINISALMEQMKEAERKKRERQFNILAGNCPECGGAMPCKEHP